MDLEATREFTRSGLELSEDKKKKHAVIALDGRFRDEMGDKCHLMPVVPVTNSRLMPAKWMNRMLDWHGETGVTRGPVFCNRGGLRARQSQFGCSIWSRLLRVSVDEPGLFS
jgi:hypothetical protein